MCRRQLLTRWTPCLFSRVTRVARPAPRRHHLHLKTSFGPPPSGVLPSTRAWSLASSVLRWPSSNFTRVISDNGQTLLPHLRVSPSEVSARATAKVARLSITHRWRGCTEADPPPSRKKLGVGRPICPSSFEGLEAVACGSPTRRSKVSGGQSQKTELQRGATAAPLSREHEGGALLQRDREALLADKAAQNR